MRDNVRQYELVTVEDGGMNGAVYHHRYLIVYGDSRQATLDTAPISRAEAAETLQTWRAWTQNSYQQWLKCYTPQSERRAALV